jgi:hypothetical protein
MPDINTDPLGPYQEDAQSHPLAVRTATWLAQLTEVAENDYGLWAEDNASPNGGHDNMTNDGGYSGEFTLHLGGVYGDMESTGRSLNVRVTEKADVLDANRDREVYMTLTLRQPGYRDTADPLPDSQLAAFTRYLRLYPGLIADEITYRPRR